jgi:hypothetical protein
MITGTSPLLSSAGTRGYFAIDVDDHSLYMSEADIAGIVTMDRAMDTRSNPGGEDHWHALVWVPEPLRRLWPERDLPGAECKGSADGFVPVPGCWHYSGVKYELAAGSRAITATEELLLAIRSQPVTERAAAAGYTGGRSEGRQGDLTRFLMAQCPVLLDDLDADLAMCEALWMPEFNRLEATKDWIIDADPHGMFMRQYRWRVRKLNEDAAEAEKFRSLIPKASTPAAASGTAPDEETIEVWESQFTGTPPPGTEENEENDTGNGSDNASGDGSNGNNGNGNGNGNGENEDSEEPGDRNDWRLACRLAGDDRYRLPVLTPAGDTFFLNRDGIEREWTDGRNNPHVERIAVQPFVISKFLRSDTGTVQCELAWLALNGDVSHRTVTWDELAGNKLTSAFGGDAVIIDRHRSACAEYIQELIVMNRVLLAAKEERVVTALGWCDDGSEFVLGPGRPCQVSDTRNLGTWLEGWSITGEYAEWRRAVSICASQPIALAMLAASFTPPLLRLLGLSPFAFDVSGVSSSGKTTGMALALSPWGNPRLAMRGWNDTTVANEHYMSVLRGLPYFLNESQLVDDPKHISSLVYALAEGRSKSRSRQDGTGNTENSGITFESVLISCGENSLASFVKKGGLAPRIVTVEGRPMESAAMADEVKEIVMANHGHAGEMFVAALRRHDIARLKTRHRSIEASLREHTVTDVAGRRAASVAAMQLAYEVALAASLVPPAIPEIWLHLANGGGALDEHADDLPMQALMALAAEVAVNPMAFWVAEGGMSVNNIRPGDLPPAGGWAGRYQATGDRQFVSVSPQVAEGLPGRPEA